MQGLKKINGQEVYLDSTRVKHGDKMLNEVINKIIDYSSGSPTTDNILFDDLNLVSGTYKLIICGRTNTTNNIKMFINGDEEDSNYFRQTIRYVNNNMETPVKENNAYLSAMYDGGFMITVDLALDSSIFPTSTVKMSASNWNGASLYTSVGTWTYLSYTTSITSIKLKFKTIHSRPIKITMVKID
jgi:hypothetical protein